MKGKHGFEFMSSLVADMVQDDPSKRPTMAEVVVRFEEIRKHLSEWKLRSPVIDRADSAVMVLYRGIGHWTRRINFIVRRVPAIPVPKFPAGVSVDVPLTAVDDIAGKASQIHASSTAVSVHGGGDEPDPATSVPQTDSTRPEGPPAVEEVQD